MPGFSSGQPARFAIGYVIGSDPDQSDVTIGLTILSRSQIAIASCESSYVGDPFNRLPAVGELVCEFDKLALLPGNYKMALKCKVGSRRVCSIPNAGDFRIEKGSFYPTGNLPPPGSGASLLEYRWSVSDTKGDT